MVAHEILRNHEPALMAANDNVPPPFDPPDHGGTSPKRNFMVTWKDEQGRHARFFYSHDEAAIFLAQIECRLLIDELDNACERATALAQTKPTKPPGERS